MPKVKSAEIVKTYGVAKKVYVGTVSVASVGLAGFLTYTFLKRNTKRRFIAAAKKVLSVKSCFPQVDASGTSVTIPDCIEDAIDPVTELGKVVKEIREAYVKAQIKNKTLTIDEFYRNILQVTEDELIRFVGPAFYLSQVLAGCGYVDNDGNRIK